MFCSLWGEKCSRLHLNQKSEHKPYREISFSRDIRAIVQIIFFLDFLLFVNTISTKDILDTGRIILRKCTVNISLKDYCL